MRSRPELCPAGAPGGTPRENSEPTQKLQTTLDAEYGVGAKRVARKQVRRAGHRLALILKDILRVEEMQWRTSS